MSTAKRQMHLGVFVLGTGNHSAGWRYEGAATSHMELPVIQEIARIAERGKFDLLFISDSMVMDPGDHPSFLCRFEPTTLITALSAATTHVGLGATVSTSFNEPFNVARIFGSIDHISGGRAAWNVVTTSNLKAHSITAWRTSIDHDLRYERAEEFVDVVKRAVGLLGGRRDRRRQGDRAIYRRRARCARSTTRAGSSRSRARSTWRAARRGIR